MLVKQRDYVSRGMCCARLSRRFGVEGIPRPAEPYAAFHCPAGLQDGSRLPEPLFTPATKSQDGAHDENISYEEIRSVLGAENAAELRRLTLAIYQGAPRTPSSAA